MPTPNFEPVSECSICGLDFPESELVRHYKTGRLVDRACADEEGADDYLARLKRPNENRRRAKQPVPASEQTQAAFVSGFNQRPFNTTPWDWPL